jgi:hypothetical protein
MDGEETPGSSRPVKLALGAALATGAILVGIGVGGLTGVDRKLEAATPKQGQTRVVDDGKNCPADKPDHERRKDSKQL